MAQFTKLWHESMLNHLLFLDGWECTTKEQFEWKSEWKGAALMSQGV